MSNPAVVIVGAGPAGLSAAVTVAAAGIRVTVVDERPIPGGRLRYDHAESTSLSLLLSECNRLGVEIRSRTVAWGLFPGWSVALETPDGAEVLETDHLILAPGALDRGLAFDGNTLPGVMTGSGLRRLIGEFGVLPGKRVLVMGDGPDGAATANAVQAAGGRVIALVPEDEARSLSVEGAGGVERVFMAGKEMPVDIVAVAIGRQPDVQLASMSEQTLSWVPERGGWIVRADDGSSAGSLFVAGDAAGVDTVDICALDGAYAAARLANLLGLIPDSDVSAIAARIHEHRPLRLKDTESAPAHRQPWLVPLEVNQ